MIVRPVTSISHGEIEARAFQFESAVLVLRAERDALWNGVAVLGRDLGHPQFAAVVGHAGAGLRFHLDETIRPIIVAADQR